MTAQDGDLTPKTEASLAARLRAIAIAIAQEPGGDATTAKFIFDLRATAKILDGAEELLGAVLEGRAWGAVESRARTLRSLLDEANPELKEAESFEAREAQIAATTGLSRAELVGRELEPEATRPDIGVDGWLVHCSPADRRLDGLAIKPADSGYQIIVGKV